MLRQELPDMEEAFETVTTKCDKCLFRETDRCLVDDMPTADMAAPDDCWWFTPAATGGGMDATVAAAILEKVREEDNGKDEARL